MGVFVLLGWEKVSLGGFWRGNGGWEDGFLFYFFGFILRSVDDQDSI